MVQMIKGETIQIVIKTPNGIDDFGQPTFTEDLETIENVIVGSPSSNDVITSTSIEGKTIAYALGIPKEDEHDFVNTDVFVRGERFRTIGIPTEYTEGNMPSWWRWNKQVRIERYE